jgi:hypothetical protein
MHSQLPLAISPPGSKGLRKTGAFLMFVAGQKETDIRMVEDSYSILVTTADWQRIREAFESGANVSIPPTKPGAASFTLDGLRALIQVRSPARLSRRTIGPHINRSLRRISRRAS